MGIFDEIEVRAKADGFTFIKKEYLGGKILDEDVITFGFPPDRVVCLSITGLEQLQLAPEKVREIVDARYSHAKDMLLSEALDREGTNG